MSLIKSSSSKKGAVAAAPAKPARPTHAAPMGVAEASFHEAFESVIVDEPVLFPFEGCISRKHMRAYWTYITREISPALSDNILEAVNMDEPAEAAIDKLVPEIVTKLRAVSKSIKESAEEERKLRAQLGSEEARDCLPVVINALRCRTLMAKANAFGRASNSLPDDAALGAALQSLPLKDQGAVALLLHTIVGQAANPSRLVASIIPIAGGAKESVIRGSGFGPLIDALLAHAQNQISRIASQSGLFSDADLMCKAVARFHRLARAVTGYIELERGSRWAMITSEITKQMAQRIEPRLREVSADVSQSLRRPREGTDVLDADRLLAALNGIYLLSTLRDARESLALNALFDKIWGETGQALEILLTRNLELFKQNPSDANTAHRLEMGIKMAEVRFNAEYAEILRRARDGASKRIVKQA